MTLPAENLFVIRGIDAFIGVDDETCVDLDGVTFNAPPKTASVHVVAWDDKRQQVRKIVLRPCGELVFLPDGRVAEVVMPLEWKDLTDAE